MKSLFFIGRHGQTYLNESGKFRGWSNGPDAQLNPKGIKAAHESGEFLQTLGQKFSRIICSPLDRAQLTAAIIAGYIDIKQLLIDDRLRPLNVGSLAGQPKEDHPIDAYLKDKNKRFPEGETVNEFEQRQYEFALELLSLLAEQKEDQEILVIAHVSNVMYWWNLQSGTNHEEYLRETSDIVQPGGLAVVTEHATLPIFKENPSSEKDAPPIDVLAIKGEYGTGYESGAKGPFRCSNCEFYKADNKSCGQKDMLVHSKQPRTSDGRVEVDPNGCCEYVTRIEEKI